MLIVLNNKSSFNVENFSKYLLELDEIKKKDNLILCPSSCYLPFCIDKDITIGSQDVSMKESLFATGEVTARQLKSLGVEYTLVGHADRDESVDMVKTKVRNLLNVGISPILCVGEEKKDSSIDNIKKDLLARLNYIMSDLKLEEREKIIIAYEPKWAINVDIDLNAKDISTIVEFIHHIFINNKILYGGGVTIDNYNLLEKIEYLDGVLVGRFGNNIDNLKKISK